VIAGGLCAAALAAARAIPPTLERWQLSPDAVEHLAIAQSLVHGSGFVDPVQWSYYLPDGPPLPAFAIRSPAAPLLPEEPRACGCVDSVPQPAVAAKTSAESESQPCTQSPSDHSIEV